MRPQAVLFDLDGTLFDTSPGIYHCLRRTLEQAGFAPLQEELFPKFIGPPLTDAFAKNTSLTPEEIHTAIQIFHGLYRTEGYFQSRLYPQMEDVLRELTGQGIRLAVCTLKKEDMAKRLLEHFHMDVYFSSVKGQDEGYHRRKKDTILLACEEMGVSPGNALLVGDSPYDREGAEEAGVGFVGVTYGFGFTQPAGGLPFADTCPQILDIVLEP